MSGKFADSFVRLIMAAIAFAILAAIFWARPYWGLMDDHFNVVTMMPDIAREGLFSYAVKYGVQDLQWGMFRPTYPVMVYILYLPALLTAPWVLYLGNSIFCFALLVFAAKVYARIIRVNVYSILAFYGAFFYLYDLFQHPSLQEKFIHLFGISLLYFCSEKKLGVWTWIGILFSAFLGVITKASFVIYLSMAVWVLFWREENWSWHRRFVKTLPLIAILVAAVSFFAYISSRGLYTTGLFSLKKIGPNLWSIDGAMFALPLLAAVLYGLVSRKLFTDPLRFTPAIGVAAFLTIFLPWGIQGYLHSLAGPFFCALLAFCAEEFFPRRSAWLIPLAIFALGIGSYRAVTIFGRLGDIRKIVALAPELEKRGIHDIEVPCSEGRGAMDHFFTHLAKVSIQVHQRTDYSQPKELDGKYFLFDRSVCPFPGRTAMVPGCEEAERVFSGFMAKSFQIVKVRCGS